LLHPTLTKKILKRKAKKEIFSLRDYFSVKPVCRQPAGADRFVGFLLKLGRQICGFSFKVITDLRSLPYLSFRKASENSGESPGKIYI